MAFKKGGFKPKKFQKKSNNVRNMAFYIVVGGLLLVSFMGLQLETGKYKKEVEVVSMKTDLGTKIIESSDLEAYRIPQKAVRPDMILWKDREDAVINKYPNMQIRKNTPVYSDMITDKQVVRYQYLYELAPDEELLTFNYDNLEAAGRIPRPGDRFRIRGSYKLSKEELELLQQSNVNVNEAGNDEDIKDEDGNVEIKSSNQGSKLYGDVRTEVVFDVATVVDMLNSKGDSIFEIIRDMESLAKAEQEKLASEDGFRESLTPSSLLIIVKSEPVGKYVQFNANANAQYTLTLLTRDKTLMEDDIRSGTSIIDSIPLPEEGGVDN